MAIFLHRMEEKISRQRQLEANPATIVHFCSGKRKLTVGHRAVLAGKPGEVLATGFVIRKIRVCKPEEVTQEEFSRAPEIANSLEKILARLSSWDANKHEIQVVTMDNCKFSAILSDRASARS
jgi:hypothetical protein